MLINKTVTVYNNTIAVPVVDKVSFLLQEPNTGLQAEGKDKRLHTRAQLFKGWLS